MTEKRFTLKYPHWTHIVCDTVKTEEYYLKDVKQREGIVELLNALHEENEQCKMMIATLRNIILEKGIDIE